MKEFFRKNNIPFGNMSNFLKKNMEFTKTKILTILMCLLLIQPVYAFSFSNWFSGITGFITKIIASPPEIISIQAIPEKVKVKV